MVPLSQRMKTKGCEAQSAALARRAAQAQEESFQWRHSWVAGLMTL